MTIQKYHWFVADRANDQAAIVDFDGKTIADPMDRDEAIEIIRLVNFARDARRADKKANEAPPRVVRIGRRTDDA